MLFNRTWGRTFCVILYVHNCKCHIGTGRRLGFLTGMVDWVACRDAANLVRCSALSRLNKSHCSMQRLLHALHLYTKSRWLVSLGSRVSPAWCVFQCTCMVCISMQEWRCPSKSSRHNCNPFSWWSVLNSPALSRSFELWPLSSGNITLGHWAIIASFQRSVCTDHLSVRRLALLNSADAPRAASLHFSAVATVYAAHAPSSRILNPNQHSDVRKAVKMQQQAPLVGYAQQSPAALLYKYCTCCVVVRTVQSRKRTISASPTTLPLHLQDEQQNGLVPWQAQQLPLQQHNPGHQQQPTQRALVVATLQAHAGADFMPQTQVMIVSCDNA